MIEAHKIKFGWDSYDIAISSLRGKFFCPVRPISSLRNPSGDTAQQPIQQQLSPSHSMADEKHLVLEGIPELTVHTPVSELMVLFETIVDFKNSKDNGFDFSETLELQG